MARINEARIQEIMDTALDEGNITTYLNVANNFVTQNLGSSGLDTATLADIEAFITAHFIAMTKERQALTEKIGDVWITYQGEFGKFLQMTTYGQTALMLDTTGTLAKVSSGTKRATIKAINQVNL